MLTALLVIVVAVKCICGCGIATVDAVGGFSVFGLVGGLAVMLVGVGVLEIFLFYWCC